MVWKSHDIGDTRTWGTIDNRISKWNVKGSQKSLKCRKDIILNILACYVTLPEKFQDKGMKRFDWVLKFSSSYCIRSSERKYPRRFQWSKTRREQFLIRYRFGQLWSSTKMMGQKRRGKQGKCISNFLFDCFGFYLVVLRTASYLTMPNTRACKATH